MNAYRYFFLCWCFLLGFLGIAGPMLAYAEGTVPAGGATAPAVQTQKLVYGSYTQWGSAGKGTCDALIAQLYAGYPSQTPRAAAYGYAPGGDYYSASCKWTMGGELNTTYYQNGYHFPESCPQGAISLNGTTCTLQATCPANSTGPTNGVCTCDSGYGPNGSQCVKTCPADGTAMTANGWIDIGVTDIGGPQSPACIDGCMVAFYGGSPAGSSLRNGIRHYYAFGHYQSKGDQSGSCSAGAPSSMTPSKPGDTCAPGQVAGEINGRGYCSNPDGSRASEDGRTAEQRTQTKQESESTQTAPDGTKTTTRTTINPDGSKTTETTTESPDGSKTTTTEVEGAKDENGGTHCEKNPDALECKQLDRKETGSLDFGEAGDAYAEIKAAYKAKLESIKAEAQSLFSLGIGGAGGGLPCGNGVMVFGREIRFCFDEYEDDLAPLGAVFVLLATVVAAGMVLRGS